MINFGDYGIAAVDSSSLEPFFIDKKGSNCLGNLGFLSGTANGVAFSPDGNYLAVAHVNGDRLTIVTTSDWSVVSGTPSLPNTANGVAFSPDGNYLAVGHSGGNNLTVINTSNWSVVSATPSLPNTGQGVAFFLDSKLKKISGTVFDGSGSPAPNRVIYAADRGDISNATTVTTDSFGFYEVSSAASFEVMRIAMADDVAEGEVYNDVIDRIIPT